MTAQGRRLVGLAAAAGLLHLVLVQPNHPGAMTWGALRLVPLELPVLCLGLAALGEGRGRRALRGGLAALLLILVALRAADAATFAAFGRGFDPVVDLHLLPAGLRLAAGVLGLGLVALGAAGAALGLGLLLWGLLRALRAWSRTGLGGGARVAAGTAAILLAAVAVSEVGRVAAGWPVPDAPGSAFTSRVGWEHARGLVRSRAEFRAFAAAAEADPWAGRRDLFDRLEGRDVLVVFVESYGRASLDNPLYAPTHAATLRGAEPALAAAGLAARSGWLASPVRGGQSWLARGTLASGLRLADQRRYNAMLASPRRTLWHLAADAGYRTAAVEPAHVLPWPEGGMLGFEATLGAADLGYRGLPFNWVTMPDQYVLQAFPRHLPPDGRPLFAEVALISSHAPWTPVPPLLPWESVGDGSAFDEGARAGAAPAAVWADEALVREQYRLSLDYSLRAVLSWAALPRVEPPLLIVLGDHQAAGFVSQGRGSDVPIHLIGPPEALAPFEAWGWTAGMVPDPALPAWPMEAFRDRFVAATTGEGPGA